MEKAAAESKRYYARVDGARFVFEDGSDCYFRNFYYDATDPEEIRQLDRLTRKNNNPLIFVPVDGEIPQFQAPSVGLALSPARVAADAADASLAATIAAAYNGEKTGLMLEQIPEAARGSINQAVLDKINAVLAEAKAEGIEVPPIKTISPEVAKDPVVAALAAGKAVVVEENAIARLQQLVGGGSPAGIPATAAESNSQ